MSNLKIGDKVSHQWGDNDERYEVRGVEIGWAWCKDAKGNYFTFNQSYLTKVEPKFEPGKTYRWTGEGSYRYHCVGVATNGGAYGFSWSVEDPTSTEAWSNASPRSRYTEVED